jgi:hypothetical protein
VTRDLYVYDPSAITAVFDGHTITNRHWQHADHGLITILLPAVAVAQVGHRRPVTPSAWEALLWPEHVHVMPLTETAAIEIGGYGTADVGVAHALWEAVHMEAVLVTRDGRLYAAGVVPLLVI